MYMFVLAPRFILLQPNLLCSGQGFAAGRTLLNDVLRVYSPAEESLHRVPHRLGYSGGVDH